MSQQSGTISRSGRLCFRLQRCGMIFSVRVSALALTLVVAASVQLTAPALAASWSVLPSPNVTGYKNGLTSVARVPGTSQFWAVGAGHSDSVSPDVPIIEHSGSGTAWSLSKPVREGSHDNGLSSVSVVSRSNVWAFGSSDNETGPAFPLVEHWNGQQWRLVAVPRTATGLTVGKAFSATDVFAAGVESAGYAVAYHWNGKAWTVTRLPTPAVCTIRGAIRADSLAAIPGSSGRFAVGSCSTAGPSAGVVWRLSAGRWHISKVIANASLSSITPVSGTSIWAVGSNASGALFLHWEGKGWASAATPAGLASGNMLGVIRVPGTRLSGRSVTMAWIPSRRSTTGDYGRWPGSRLPRAQTRTSWPPRLSPHPGPGNVIAVGGYLTATGPVEGATLVERHH